MVAKITTGSNIYGALTYTQEKVDAEKGELLTTHILREPVDGRFSVVDMVDWGLPPRLSRLQSKQV
jgi:hypothetical protein